MLKNRRIAAATCMVGLIPFGFWLFEWYRVVDAHNYILSRGGYIDCECGASQMNPPPFRLYLEVNWSRSAVTDDEIENVVRLCPIDTINVGGNGDITDVGLERLACRTGTKLIYLHDTSVTRLGIKSFKNNHPDCRVFHSHIEGATEAQQTAADVLRQYGARILTNDDWRPIEVSLANLRSVSDDVGDALRQFPSLQSITLYSTGVGDSCVAKLVSQDQLKRLDLGRTGVTDHCVDTLLKLSRLRYLSLYHTAISDASVDRLRKRLRRCYIVLP